MNINYIAVSDELGVYLGECFGLGFWSKLDSAGQEEAVCFKSPDDFWKYSKEWDSPPPSDTYMMEIFTKEKMWATMQECVNAGAEAWEV